MDANTITTATIRTLSTEAAAAGDMDTVETCRVALDKSIPTADMMRARQRCADIIDDAAAQV